MLSPCLLLLQMGWDSKLRNPKYGDADTDVVRGSGLNQVTVVSFTIHKSILMLKPNHVVKFISKAHLNQCQLAKVLYMLENKLCTYIYEHIYT